MNLYRLHFISPNRPHFPGITLYRLGVAALMDEVRKAHRWGYTLKSIELG